MIADLLVDATFITYLIVVVISLLILCLFSAEVLRERTYKLSFFFWAFVMTWFGILLSTLVTLQARYYCIVDKAERDVVINGTIWFIKDWVTVTIGMATIVAIIIRISGRRTKD